MGVLDTFKILAGEVLSTFGTKYNALIEKIPVSGAMVQNGLLRLLTNDGSQINITVPKVPNSVLAGCELSVVDTTAVIQPGEWQIDAVTYQKLSQTNLTIDAIVNPVNTRIDVVYATTANTFLLKKGLEATVPGEPTIAANELKIGIIVTTSGGSGVPSEDEDVNSSILLLDTIEDLKDENTTVALDYPDKTLVYIKETESFYSLDRDSALVEDTSDYNYVVEPTTGTGKWIRSGIKNLDTYRFTTLAQRDTFFTRYPDLLDSGKYISIYSDSGLSFDVSNKTFSGEAVNKTVKYGVYVYIICNDSVVIYNSVSQTFSDPISTENPEDEYNTDAVVAGDLLYIASAGKLYVLDLTTNLPEGYVATPGVPSGSYVNTVHYGNGKVYAIDLGDTPGVIIVDADDKLYLNFVAMPGIGTAPAFTGPEVWFGGDATDKIERISSTTNALLTPAITEATGPQELFYTGGKVFSTSDTPYHIRVYDAITRNLLFTYAKPSDGVFASANFFYAHDNYSSPGNTKVIVISGTTGAIVTEYTAVGFVSSSGILYNGLVFFFGTGGSMSFNDTTGALNAAYPELVGFTTNYDLIEINDVFYTYQNFPTQLNLLEVLPNNGLYEVVNDDEFIKRLPVRAQAVSPGGLEGVDLGARELIVEVETDIDAVELNIQSINQTISTFDYSGLQATKADHETRIQNLEAAPGGTADLVLQAQNSTWGARPANPGIVTWLGWGPLPSGVKVGDQIEIDDVAPPTSVSMGTLTSVGGTLTVVWPSGITKGKYTVGTSVKVENSYTIIDATVSGKVAVAFTGTSVVIIGLNAGETYYIGVQSEDDDGNVSIMQVPVSFTTAASSTFDTLFTSAPGAVKLAMKETSGLSAANSGSAGSGSNLAHNASGVTPAATGVSYNGTTGYSLGSLPSFDYGLGNWLIGFIVDGDNLTTSDRILVLSNASNANQRILFTTPGASADSLEMSYRKDADGTNTTQFTNTSFFTGDPGKKMVVVKQVGTTQTRWFNGAKTTHTVNYGASMTLNQLVVGAEKYGAGAVAGYATIDAIVNVLLQTGTDVMSDSSVDALINAFLNP